MEALLLVGHGSHLNGDASDPVFRHAAAIRRAGVFAEVREAFWKEEPGLRRALDLVAAPGVYVVPFFASDGYFTQRVIPRELELAGPVTERDGRRVRYCEPVGTHPEMPGFIVRRAEEALARERAGRAASDDVALLVVGHGTESHAGSSMIVYEHAEQIRDAGRFTAVECGFLDEEPRMDRVLAELTAGTVVIVPFFMADGWHTRETIPEELGLTGARTERAGRLILYTPPIGTFDALSELILERARQAGAGSAQGAGGEQSGGGVHASGAAEPAVAERAGDGFVAWIDEAGDAGRRFLQARVRRTGDGGYEVRHVDDAEMAAAALRTFAAPEAARQIAATTAAGAYRPLRTAPDLARGWRLAGLDAAGLREAFAHLYPAAVAQWQRGREGSLAPTSFRESAGRQSGHAARARELDDAAVARVAAACCGPAGCLRTVAWPLAAGGAPLRPSVARGAEPAAGEAAAGDALVPCPEPCSVFLGLAREIAVREEAPRAPTALSAEERAQLRAALDAAAAASAARAGDFADPLNPRRLRYLAQRVGDG
jgi:sirohydrochlorin cobaltochelatase